MILALGLFSGLISSYKSFITPRLFFPYIPFFEFLQPMPVSLEYILFGALLVLLVIIMISSSPSKYIFIFISLTSIFIVWDQLRLHAWLYQYEFMFVALGIYFWSSKKGIEKEKALNICRIIIASIYFWSGIQKINVSFMRGLFPSLLDPFIGYLPEQIHAYINLLGFIAPFAELAIGIGLLTLKFRNVSIFLALAIHTMLLLSLGPLGHNWNVDIWPWNITMMFLVFILFWQSDHVSIKRIVASKSLLLWVVTLMFGIMPFFGLFGIWDANLSWALYSANLKEAEISFTALTKNTLPRELLVHTYSDLAGGYTLDIFSWNVEELGVQPYPETRIFKKIGQYVCECTDNQPRTILKIYDRPNPISGLREVKQYVCGEL